MNSAGYSSSGSSSDAGVGFPVDLGYPHLRQQQHGGAVRDHHQHRRRNHIHGHQHLDGSAADDDDGRQPPFASANSLDHSGYTISANGGGSEGSGREGSGEPATTATTTTTTTEGEDGDSRSSSHRHRRNRHAATHRPRVVHHDDDDDDEGEDTVAHHSYMADASPPLAAAAPLPAAAAVPATATDRQRRRNEESRGTTATAAAAANGSGDHQHRRHHADPVALPAPQQHQHQDHHHHDHHRSLPHPSSRTDPHVALSSPSPPFSAAPSDAISSLGEGYGPSHQHQPHRRQAPGPVRHGTQPHPSPLCASPTTSSGDWVRLNVGGREFVTTFATLCADPDTVLAKICEPLLAERRRIDKQQLQQQRRQQRQREVEEEEAHRRQQQQRLQSSAVSRDDISHHHDDNPNDDDDAGESVHADESSLCAGSADGSEGGMAMPGASGGGGGDGGGGDGDGGSDATPLPCTDSLNGVAAPPAALTTAAPTQQQQQPAAVAVAVAGAVSMPPTTTPAATAPASALATHTTATTTTATANDGGGGRDASADSALRQIRRSGGELPNLGDGPTNTNPTSGGVGVGGVVLPPLASAPPLVGSAPLDLDDHRGILLDLDPDYFTPILNYLRHRTVIIPPALSARGVLAVAEYLNVQGMVRQLAPERRIRRQVLSGWGSGGSGELGTQRFSDSEAPTPVQVTPFGVKVTHMALGANYSCALSDDGNIYTFGNGDWGQLGLGPPKDLDVHPGDRSAVVVVPRRIPLFERLPAIHVSAGYAFAMAIVHDHHVYFWGNNNHGQSGLGARFFDYNTRKIEEPKLVDTLEGKRIVQVGCGSFFSLALGEDGTLYSWGLIECLGLGSPDEVRRRFRGTDVIGDSLSNEKRGVMLAPQPVTIRGSGGSNSSSNRIVRIHAGQWHSGAINAAGELFTWGVGYQGRLGHGTKDPAYVPTMVRGALSGHRVIDVACGSFHTVALTDRGAVFCWGDNASGQCGTSATHADAVTSPYRVVGLEFIAGGVARSISCGRQHTVVVMAGPQPGCHGPCCQLDYRGRPYHPHAQVYTFGESNRSSGAGKNATATGNTSGSGAAGNNDVVVGLGINRGVAGGVSGGGGGGNGPSVLITPSGRGGGGNNSGGGGRLSDAAASPLEHQLRQQRQAAAMQLGHHTRQGTNTAADTNTAAGRTCTQYHMVPGLEWMNVLGVVSGLHHTFVYAEEIDATAGGGGGGGGEEAWGATEYYSGGGADWAAAVVAPSPLNAVGGGYGGGTGAATAATDGVGGAGRYYPSYMQRYARRDDAATAATAVTGIISPGGAGSPIW